MKNVFVARVWLSLAGAFVVMSAGLAWMSMGHLPINPQEASKVRTPSAMEVAAMRQVIVPTPRLPTTQIRNLVPTVNRPDIVQRVRSMERADSLQVRRIDRLEARLVLNYELDAEKYAGGTPPWIYNYDPDRLVWVVAFQGEFRPQFGKGKSYPWGVFTFDAVTGQNLGANADTKGSWPAYFDRLADRSIGLDAAN